MEKVDECVICFESYDQEGHRSIVLHPCGHVFGRPCIMDHFRLRKKNFGSLQNTAPCPLCKTPFNKNQIGSLFIPTTTIPTGSENKKEKEQISNLQNFISEMTKEKIVYETIMQKHRVVIEEKDVELNNYKSHTHNLATALYQAQIVQNQLMQQKAELAAMVEQQKREIENLKNSGKTLANTLLKFSLM